MLLREHRGPIAADFQRHYGLPLHLMPWGMPLRDVAALAANLPTDSATARAMDPDHLWTLEAHLLATIADGIGWLAWSKSKGAEDNPSRPPAQIPRPGVDPDAGKEVKTFGSAPVPLADLDAFFATQPEEA